MVLADRAGHVTSAPWPITLAAVGACHSPAYAPLRTDPDLARLAREYSCALLQRGALSHTDPDGKTVADPVLAAGKSLLAVGETLASSMGPGDPRSAAIDAWMRSAGHRENILRPDFVETGVGICLRGDTYYFTQVLVRPAPKR